MRNISDFPDIKVYYYYLPTHHRCLRDPCLLFPCPLTRHNLPSSTRFLKNVLQFSNFILLSSAPRDGSEDHTYLHSQTEMGRDGKGGTAGSPHSPQSSPGHPQGSLRWRRWTGPYLLAAPEGVHLTKPQQGADKQLLRSMSRHMISTLK